MKDEKEIFDIVCKTPLRCVLFVFGGTYLLWWLVLDGPAKWDAKFKGKFENIKKEKTLPVFIKDPLEDVTNKK